MLECFTKYVENTYVTNPFDHISLSFRREARRKGKAFNLHLSCYSLDRLAPSCTTPTKNQCLFSYFRGKDNLTSNMMGEVMRQVIAIKKLTSAINS